MEIIEAKYKCARCGVIFICKPINSNVIELKTIFCRKCHQAMFCEMVEENEEKKIHSFRYQEGSREAKIFYNNKNKFISCDINFKGPWSYDDWMFLKNVADTIKNNY